MTTDLTFAGLGLAEPLLRAISEAGYTTPTPIQAQAIPLVLKGSDLLAAAQTGTGKTAGFVLPILQLLAGRPADLRSGHPRCLVLTPTRELAAQVCESVRTYGKHMPLRSMVMYGGVGMQPQFDALRRRVDILVATPGRLLDHAGQRSVDLSGVEILVLDEGDRMLDMGFIPDIRRVIGMLPRKRQNLLFSATFSDEIRRLADGMLHNPVSVEVARRNTASELVAQSVHLIDTRMKRHLLGHLIRTRNWWQVLVFTRTKHGANRLADQLSRQSIDATAIHGNKSQSARTRALAEFKSGRLQVLVATDIAARGLDIDQLPQVVNFELPNVPEDYVHRIGRTGRAGAEGAAVSLVSREEMPFLASIERLLGKKIERVAVTDFVAPAIDPREEANANAAQRTESRRGRPQQQRDDSRRYANAPSTRSGADSRPAPRAARGHAQSRSGQPGHSQSHGHAARPGNGSRKSSQRSGDRGRRS